MIKKIGFSYYFSIGASALIILLAAFQWAIIDLITEFLYLPLAITIWIVFFVLISVFGFYASKKNWKKEHDELFKEFQEFKKAMRGNEK